MAEAEAAGIKSAGGECDMFLIPETLSSEVLTKMHAPSKEGWNIPTLDDPAKLEEYDAFLFGIPTRYGNFPAQWKTFWDKTGGQWAKGEFLILRSEVWCMGCELTGWVGGFWGKMAGVFISTGTMGGGQESTAIASMSTLAHHGIIFVPLGYKTVFPMLSNLEEVHGGSPWGAGTFSVSLPLSHLPLLHC